MTVTLSPAVVMCVLSLAMKMVLAQTLPPNTHPDSPIHRLFSQNVSHRVALEPSDPSQPGWGSPGGSRGPILNEGVTDDNELVALVDQGQTLSDYPTLFVYLPTILKEIVTFYGPLDITVTLWDDEDTMLHQSSRTAPDTAGILGIPFADLEDVAALAPNQIYRWQLTISSPNPDLVLSGAALSGEIERVDVAAIGLSTADLSLEEQPYFYSDAEIWYDAVTSFFGLRQTSPDHPTLEADLQALLVKVGLEDITPDDFIGYWPELSPTSVGEDGTSLSPVEPVNTY